MNELWLTFTDYVDSNEAMVTTIIFMMKRAVRDRNRNLRLTCMGQLFRILEELGQKKNQSAPLIYKTLIFSLMESPNDPIIREAIYSNFIALFQENPNIPISLLIDPLFKLIPTQLGTTYMVKSFDFDFFLFIANHPKLTVI